MDKLEKLKQLEMLLQYEIMKKKHKRELLIDYSAGTFKRISEVIDSLDLMEIFDYINSHYYYWIIDEYLRYLNSTKEMIINIEAQK